MDNRKKILFIINPVAGGTDKTNTQQKIKSFCKSKQISYYLFNTTGSNDLLNIRKNINSFNPDKVVAVGGDGTVKLTAKALLNNNISLGIIPLGSANGLATELGIPGNINQALNRLLEGKEKKIDVVQINDDISIHISDFGLNANIIYRFERKKQRGLLSYLRHFLQELFTIRGTTYIIKSGEKLIKEKATMLLIANSTMFGTGIKINRIGKIDDGVFEIIVIRSYKTKDLIQKFVKFIKGEIDHFALTERIQTQHAVINNPHKKNLQIDGEIAGQPEKVVVNIKPRALTVIV